MRTHPLERVRTSEYAAYVALTVALCAAYLVVAFVPPLQGDAHLQRAWFGFSQLHWAGVPLTLAILALALVRASAPARREETRTASAGRSPMARGIMRAGIALAAAAVFFLLRNEFLNTDGQMFAGKFAHALRTGGTAVTHDEMWELYVHARLWIAAHAWWGWSVKLTYQALSAVAGGLFVLLLLEYCGLITTPRPGVGFLACVSGGYMQLFFGDVENYSLTAALIMAYFLASAWFLRGRVRLWQPSVLLAIAMTFHLVAGFLVPSLAFLWWLAWRDGGRRTTVAAIAAFVAVLAATLAFFHWSGLPISQLFTHSHAFGDGGHFRHMLVRPSVAYYLGMFNLVALLVPAFVLIVPLALFRRIPRDRENLHLLVASGFMALFVLAWNAGLGVYQDWNLFAPAALPVTLLVWRNVLRLDVRRGRFRPIPVLIGLCLAHSLAWIVVNHFAR